MRSAGTARADCQSLVETGLGRLVPSQHSLVDGTAPDHDRPVHACILYICGRALIESGEDVLSEFHALLVTTRPHQVIARDRENVA